MLTETGTVIALDDDGVWVETLQQSACSQCKARHGCGQKLLANAESRLTRIKALYSDAYLGAVPQLGQQVTIGVDANAMVRGALLSYGVPLLCMLVVVAIASLLTNTELVMLAAGVSGLLGGGLFVRKYAQILPNKQCLQAVLLSTLAPLQDPLH